MNVKYVEDYFVNMCEWMIKNKSTCPMRCEIFNINSYKTKHKKNVKFNKIKCINYPESKVILEYWDV